MLVNLALLDFGIDDKLFTKLNKKELQELTNKIIYNGSNDINMDQLLISQQIIISNKQRVRFSTTVKIYDSPGISYSSLDNSRPSALSKSKAINPWLKASSKA